LLERLRIPLAAVAALALATTVGMDGGLLYRWLFPYYLLFFIVEAFGSRRRLDAESVFIWGAAYGLAVEGIYTKSLQLGGLFFGIDWLGIPVACVEWGFIAVAALHLAEVVLPRESASRTSGPARSEWALAVLAVCTAGIGYALRTISGVDRLERMIGPGGWAADGLLAVGVAALASTSEAAAARRGRIVRAVIISGLWVSGVRVAGYVGVGVSTAAGWALAAAWSAAAAWAYALPRRIEAAVPARAARLVFVAVAVRLAGRAAVSIAFGDSAEFVPRSPGAILFVELPARLLLAWAFLTAPLAV
jgi:hypothetical protein